MNVEAVRFACTKYKEVSAGSVVAHKCVSIIRRGAIVGTVQAISFVSTTK